MPDADRLKRQIGLFSAVAIVVANMVGTGIFTTSGFIISEVQHPGALLLCWLAGGIFALCGALCYGELGARYPQAGGEYIYLREAFGRPTAFLSGWISLIVGFSAPIAAAAIAFASYLIKATGLSAGAGYVLSIGGTPIVTLSLHVVLAVMTVLLLSLVHIHSLGLGSRFQNVMTLFKVGLLVVFIAAGLLKTGGSIQESPAVFSFGKVFDGKFAVALIFVSFAYSGWNAASYLGGEIRRPKRNLPMALWLGTVIVMTLYLLLNLVYVSALTPDRMQGVLEVGEAAASDLFGQTMGRWFSAGISIGLISALSAMILTGPRVYYAMSRDRIFFSMFARIHTGRHTPVHAIGLQAAIASLMIVTASYDKLLIYIGFTLSLFAMLTVAGLMRVRMVNPRPSGRGINRVGRGLYPCQHPYFKETPALRPGSHPAGMNPTETDSYRTWGYPVTPLIFIAGNLWIIAFTIKNQPVPSLCGAATIALGWGVYRYFSRQGRRQTASKHMSRSPLHTLLSDRGEAGPGKAEESNNTSGNRRSM